MSENINVMSIINIDIAMWWARQGDVTLTLNEFQTCFKQPPDRKIHGESKLVNFLKEITELCIF